MLDHFLRCTIGAMESSLIESRLSHIESKVQAIDSRNIRVEAAKAWETSWTRILGNTLATYITMNLILLSIDGPFPPIHALVPTAGYLLSTLSLPILRRWWMGRFLAGENRMTQPPEDTL